MNAIERKTELQEEAEAFASHSSTPFDTVLTTFSGTKVHVRHPQPEEICFHDVLMGLSRVQRFGGQIHGRQSEFYSVAEHSVLVSRLCRPEHAILGLLHDASEAFIGDVVTPLKKHLPEYYRLELVWMRAISRAAGLGKALINLPIDIKIADMTALQIERRDLFFPSRVDPEGAPPTDLRVAGFAPADARRHFVHRWKEITGRAPLGKQASPVTREALSLKRRINEPI